MPSPPHTALAATTLRGGKAHEALLFRLAVELGCPLACELPPGPVTHQHHGLLLDPAGSVTPSPGLRASVASLALSRPVPCAGVAVRAARACCLEIIGIGIGIGIRLY